MSKLVDLAMETSLLSESLMSLSRLASLIACRTRLMRPDESSTSATSLAAVVMGQDLHAGLRPLVQSVPVNCQSRLAALWKPSDFGTVV